MGRGAAGTVWPGGAGSGSALIDTPQARRLARVLGQAGHLLAPGDPPHSLIDILYSRVSHDPDWGAQAQALAASRKPWLFTEPEGQAARLN